MNITAAGIIASFRMTNQEASPLIPLRKATLMVDKKENEFHIVTSHNQSGGVTAHTVNIDTKTPRSLGAELKASLLRDLPNDRPVQVWGMNGNSESMNFATEIYDALKASGYTMVSDSVAWHMFFNPPVFNIKISEGNGGTESWIVVGPAE